MGSGDARRAVQRSNNDTNATRLPDGLAASMDTGTPGTVQLVVQEDELFEDRFES